MQEQSKKQKKAILQQFKFNPQRINKLTENFIHFLKKNNSITCPQTYVKLATHESCPCEFDICTVVQCHSQ